MDINKLIDGVTRSLLEDSHLKRSVIKRNYQAGFNFIASFYDDSKYEALDDAFFADCYRSISARYESGCLSEQQFKKYRKCIMALKQYTVLGTTRYECFNNTSFIDPLDQSEKVLQDFLETIKSKKSSSTIKSKGNIIRQLFRYIADTEEADLKKLTAKTISSFMEHMSVRRQAGLSSVVPAIRDFMRYLHKIGITKNDLSASASVRIVRRQRIHGVFTADEIENILKSIDTQSPIGKRDFAIMLLSSRTGLRGSDILNMKLSDINWKEAEISVVQKKTLSAVACPIDVETGDALADYILNARPYSGFTNVFLSTPLARPFTSSDLCSRLKKYMEAAGVIRVSDERIGMHTFRRSLGTNLAESGAELETIAQILGHKNTASTKQYLSVAEQKLIGCTLPMPCYTGTMEVDHV